MDTIPVGIAVSAWLLAIAIAGVANAQINPPQAVPEEQNSLRLQGDTAVFQTFGQGSPTFRQQSERFRDPQQRAAMRAEQRAQILASHQDIGAILDINPATEQKLIDLLADFQLGDLEQFYTSAAARSRQGDPWEPLKTRAERETEKVQALRSLLGQERLERYQAFAPHVNDYRQVAKLDERLAPANKLTLDQKRRLAELWGEQTRIQIESSQATMRPFAALNPWRGQQLPSQEELQRNSQLMTIASNEENWRRMPQADEQMRQRAAEFLTPTQLDVLMQMNAERAENLRQWIEGARVRMGMSAEIPAQSEEPQLSPLPRAGDVKVAVKLTINDGEATHYTDTVRNGGSVTFRCAEGLFVEVRPTMYVDDAYHVRVLYYEIDSRGGKRLIGEGGQMGTYTPGSPSNGYGGTVITGNRGYAIQLSTQVEPG